MADDRAMIDAEAQVRASERVGVMLHAAEHCARVDAALANGRIGAEAASLTKEHIRAFAGEVATALHLSGSDSRETRRAVRAALAETGLMGGRGNG